MPIEFTAEDLEQARIDLGYSKTEYQKTLQNLLNNNCIKQPIIFKDARYIVHTFEELVQNRENKKEIE